MTPPPPAVLSFAEIGEAIRREFRVAGLVTLVGTAGALALSLLLPARFEATATLVLRDPSDGSASGASLPAALSGAASSASSLGLAGLGDPGIETELEVLRSDSILRTAIRAAGLNAELMSPADGDRRRLLPGARGVDTTLLRPIRLEVPASSDGPAPVLPALSLTGALPSPVTLRIRDVEEAARRIRRSGLLEVEAASGDAATIRARAGHPDEALLLASEVATAYLAERASRNDRMRGARDLLLSAAADSLSLEWEGVLGRYREALEEQQAFSPRQLGVLERVPELQARLDLARVEARALERLRTEAAQVPSPSDPGLLRRIAGIPGFEGNEAIQVLIERLLEARANRESLLRSRAPIDPEVEALDRVINLLEGELSASIESYSRARLDEVTELERELAAYAGGLSDRPDEETRFALLREELERLTGLRVSIQSQRLQSALSGARLGAEVRVIDPPVRPRKPVFPNLPLTLALGGSFSLLLGLFLAAWKGLASDRAVSPAQVSARLGLPCGAVDAPSCLFLPRGASGVALLPVGLPAEVAERIALRLRPEPDSAPPGWSVRVLPSVGALASAPSEPVVLLLPPGAKVLSQAERQLASLREAGIPTAGVLLAPRT